MGEGKEDAWREGCQRFEAGLAAYLEGEDPPAVYAHAQDCPFCGAILADLRAIRLASREMPLEEPPARVWSNIRAQLAAEGIFRQAASRWTGWLQFPALLPRAVTVATLAGLLVLGALLIVRLYQPGIAPREPSAQIVNPASTPAGFWAEDKEMIRTIGEMETSYRASAERLDPALRVVYDKGLQSLDSSIDECRASVQREPANDLAHEYLLSAYAQKAEVLASALEIEGR